MRDNNQPKIQLGRKIADYNKDVNSYVKTHKNVFSFFAKFFMVFVDSFSAFKTRLVSRIHWGRSSYYKNLVHGFMVLSTLAFLVFNVSTRISSVTTVDSGNLVSNDSVSGTADLLEQGGNINSVLIQNLETGLIIYKYTVKEGDTLESIADNYNITIDTIKEANDQEYPALFLGEQIQVGWELDIPEINGFTHEVKPGENLDEIISRYASGGNTEANRFNVIEFNNLVEPFEIAQGDVLFIPDGNSSLVDNFNEQVDINALRGAFIDPLSHPDCGGYNYSRGFTYYHNGVDLAKWNGCPIESVADGIVEYSGYAPGGQGYMVRINHGGSIKTEYFHGNGVFYVSAGEVVKQGDILMQMGCSGYCTGTHLHFILWVNSRAIDPAPYVPYTRR